MTNIFGSLIIYKENNWRRAAARTLFKEKRLGMARKTVEKNQTRLIFVRHGQSIGNKNGTFLGHTDLDLTPLGYKQAASACRYIAENYVVDAVIASDLMRAWHTVQPLAEALGLPLVLTSEFREIDAGVWENCEFVDIAERYKADFYFWREDFGNAWCPGGESVVSLWERIGQATEKLVSENKGKTICIGTHATPIRLLRGMWRGLPVQRAGDVDFPTNASATVVLYDEDGTVHIEEDGNNAYLGDAKTENRFVREEIDE